MKNWTVTSFCARRSAVSESTREPVKRQTMMTLAEALYCRVEAEADQGNGAADNPSH